MEIEFDSVDTEQISVCLKMTALVSEWRTLAQELPINQPSCAVLKERINAMLQANRIVQAVR